MPLRLEKSLSSNRINFLTLAKDCESGQSSVAHEIIIILGNLETMKEGKICKAKEELEVIG